MTFIVISFSVYMPTGTAPATLPVSAGGFNGLVLPTGLGIFTYVGFARSDLVGGVAKIAGC